MLLNLHVKNLALIDEIEVYFNDSLNILTGETGAGKSIIIGSINAALGGKVSKDIIRKGADYALIELVFQVDDNNTIESLKQIDIYPEEDGKVIISRKIMNGKSINKINGENVTASMIKEVAGLLIDIHGQHEHQSLLYKSKHLEILDKFAKDELSSLKDELIILYEEYTKIKLKLDESTIDEDKRLRELSFYEYEIQEIEEANLIIGEDDELAERFKALANYSKIKDGLTETYQRTGYDINSAGDAIGRAVKSLSAIQDYDKELTDYKVQLDSIDSLLNDFNREISNYMSSFDFDEEENKNVEDRLNLLNKLKSKFGSTIKEIMEYKASIEEKSEQLRHYDMYITDLRKELEKCETRLKNVSNKISAIRKKQSLLLSEKIKEALLELNFLDVQFEIQFKKLDRYTKNGIDEAEFMISTNPGEVINPLAKVASGGELSRIMLAIKSVLADNDAVDTLIFDEIDVGISGRTAQKVSERLSLISKNHQVICITHLAQIASMADSHFVIEKITDKESTVTSIKELNETEIIYELARILSGAKVTDTVIESAKEMKELAKSTKKY